MGKEGVGGEMMIMEGCWKNDGEGEMEESREGRRMLGEE